MQLGLNETMCIFIRGTQRRFDTNRRGRSQVTTEAKAEPIRGQHLVKCTDFFGVRSPLRGSLLRGKISVLFLLCFVSLEGATETMDVCSQGDVSASPPRTGPPAHGSAFISAPTRKSPHLGKLSFSSGSCHVLQASPLSVAVSPGSK